MIDINRLVESKRVEITFADSDINKEFVKDFRQKNHLTQLALANILGVTKKTIEKWEQGVNKVGGSSAVLLNLLSENPELLKQLYHVKTGVVGRPVDEEYKPVDSKVIKATTNSKTFKLSRLPLVAIL